MRRVGCLIFALALLMASFALAESPPDIDMMMAFVDAFPQKPGQTMETNVLGRFGSAVVAYEVPSGVQWDGAVYDLTAKALVVWEDLFLDADAAATRIEEMIAEADDGNAYAEIREAAPVPRGSFALIQGQLTIFYPRSQYALFSGHSGAFSFFAYELEGLLQPELPLYAGDVLSAKATLETALMEGVLPNMNDAYPIGSPMAKAADALRLLDVPDIANDYAVWRFEAPQMRGAALLSSPDDDEKETATIQGVSTERIDFSGLCAGIATREECVAALGAPNTETKVETADAYSRLPVGETLGWEGSGRTLELHFVEGVLHSLTLRAL